MAVSFEDTSVDDKTLIQKRQKKKRQQKIIFLSLVIGIFLLFVIVIGAVVGGLKNVQDKEETTSVDPREYVTNGDPEGRASVDSGIWKNVTDCPEQWLEISGTCFLFLSESCPSGCPWSFSKQLCTYNDGGILAEPKEPKLLEDLMEYAGNPANNVSEYAYWIGLRYDGDSQDFVWDSDEEKVHEIINEKFWFNDKPTYDGINVYMITRKTASLSS